MAHVPLAHTHIVLAQSHLYLSLSLFSLVGGRRGWRWVRNERERAAKRLEQLSDEKSAESISAAPDPLCGLRNRSKTRPGGLPWLPGGYSSCPPPSLALSASIGSPFHREQLLRVASFVRLSVSHVGALWAPCPTQCSSLVLFFACERRVAPPSVYLIEPGRRGISRAREKHRVHLAALISRDS